MSSENLARLVGVAIALILGWSPFLSTWYDKQTSQAKAGIAALVAVVLALGIFGLTCIKVNLIPGLTCSKQGAIEWAILTVNTLVFMAGGYYTLVRSFKPDADRK